MRHSRTDKSPWIAGLLCVVALVSGCQADKDGQRELLINELRLHEDTIYDLEADLDEADRRLDATRRENTILKQEITTLQSQIPQPKKENSLDRLKKNIFGDPVLNPAQPGDAVIIEGAPLQNSGNTSKTDASPKTDGLIPNTDSQPMRDSSPQLAPPPPPKETTPSEKLNFRKTSFHTSSIEPKTNKDAQIASATADLRAYFTKKPVTHQAPDDENALVQNDSIKYRRAIQNDPPPSDTSQNHYGQSDAEPAQPMMHSVLQKDSVLQNNNSAQNQNGAQNGNSYQSQLREPRRLPQSQNQRSLQQSQQQQLQQQRVAQQRPQQNRATSQQFSQQQFPQQRTARTSHNQNPGQIAGSIPAPLDGALGNIPPAIKAPASAVHHITINPRLTGGHNADRKPGDEGIMVVFSPQDDQNRQLFVQGDISIVLLDTKLQARSARWDYSADEAVKFFRKSPIGGEAYHLELRWPNLPPPNPQQEVFIRFTTGTGQKFEASRICPVEARIEGETPSIAAQTPIAANPGLQPSTQNSSDAGPPAFNINIPDVTQPNQFNPSTEPSHSSSASRDRLSRRSGIGQRLAGSRSSRSSQSQSTSGNSIDTNSELDVQIAGMPNGGSASNQPLYANGVRNNSTGSTWWNPLSWFSNSGSNASTSNSQTNAPSYQNRNSLAPQNGFAIVPLDRNAAPNTNAIGPSIAGSPINSNGQTGNSTNESLAPRWSGNAPSATITPSTDAMQSPRLAEKPEWRPYR